MVTSGHNGAAKDSLRRMYNLQQLNTTIEPTHNKSRVLNVILTKALKCYKTSVMNPVSMSDHFHVFFFLSQVTRPA